MNRWSDSAQNSTGPLFPDLHLLSFVQIDPGF